MYTLMFREADVHEKCCRGCKWLQQGKFSLSTWFLLSGKIKASKESPACECQAKGHSASGERRKTSLMVLLRHDSDSDLLNLVVASGALRGAFHQAAHCAGSVRSHSRAGPPKLITEDQELPFSIFGSVKRRPSRDRGDLVSGGGRDTAPPTPVASTGHLRPRGRIPDGPSPSPAFDSDKEEELNKATIRKQRTFESVPNRR
jgi:hypothetical protein